MKRTSRIRAALLFLAAASGPFAQNLQAQEPEPLFPSVMSYHQGYRLSSASGPWSPTYLVYVDWPSSFAMVAAVDGRGGALRVDAVVGVVSRSEELGYLPTMQLGRRGRMPLPADMWEVGAHDPALLAQGLEIAPAWAFQIEPEQYEAALEVLRLRSDVEDVDPAEPGGRADAAAFLQSLSGDLITVLDLEPPPLFALLGGAPSPLTSLVRPVPPSGASAFQWTASEQLTAGPGLDYALEFGPQDRRVVNDRLNESTTVEAVRLAEPLWTDGHQAWCYLGEVVEDRPHGLGVLYLSPYCSGPTLAGDFLDGLLGGVVVEGSGHKLAARGQMERGRRSGPWVRFGPEGVVLSSEIYRNGVPVAGPIIVGEMRHPLLQGMGGRVARQLVGVRDAMGTVQGTWIPVTYQEEMEEGRTWRTDGETLVEVLDGWGWASYTLAAEQDGGPLVASGPCNFVFENGGRAQGTCAEHTSAAGVERYLSGACTQYHPDGLVLTGTCVDGHVQGSAYLQGGDAGQQFVDVGADGRFQYRVPNDFQRIWDGIGDALEDTWRLVVDPETWVNPNVWIDTTQRLIREGTRVIERDEELAALLEEACGPDTGGCGFATIALADAPPAPFIPPAPDDVFTGRVSRDPAGRLTTGSVYSGPSWSGPPIITANARYSGLDVVLQSFGVVMELLQMNRLQLELDGVTADWRTRLGAGEIIELECGVRSARLVGCYRLDGLIPLDPAVRTIRHTVVGELPADVLYPQAEWVREWQDQQLMDELPEWARRRLLNNDPP